METINRDLQAVFDWIDGHREAAIRDLQRLVQQPSVSAQGIGLEECADLVATLMEAAGLPCQVEQTPGGPPCIFGHLRSGRS